MALDNWNVNGNFATFNVPVRFAFSPAPTRWSAGTATVEGWSHDEGKSLLGSKENAADVTVESGAAVFRVEMERSDLPPGILGPDENRTKTPNIAGRGFRVLISPTDSLPDKDRTVSDELLRDAWVMRDEFFALEQGDFDGLHAFLQRWGAITHAGPQGGWIPSTRSGGYLLLVPEFVWSQQDMIREEAPHLSLQEWLARAPKLPAWKIEELPWYTIRRHDIAGAIVDTITIDKMREHEHAICALDGCGILFAKSTKHKRDYCSDAHSLRARQRRFARNRKVDKS